MGRTRKSLDEQQGNLTRAQQDEKILMENAIKTGSEQLKRSPAWLRDNIAKKEWKRLTKQFEELDVISNLDYNNLGAYCNAFSSFLEISDGMKSEPFTVGYVNKVGAKNIVPNPLIQLQMKYSDEMRKYSSLLGLTIDSRLKIAAIKINKEKGDIEGEFGDL